MLVVIKTGGKQYIVSPGQKIKIEKIKKPSSKDEIVFNEVLLLQKGNKTEIGDPTVKGVKVEGKIIREGKGKKIIVFKYKPKKRYKRKIGHRQPFVEVEITKINI